jgi:lipid-binding SYLF domain-containing protein
MKKLCSYVVIGLLAMPLAAAAESTWENVKKGVGGAVDSVTDAAKSLTETETTEQTRSKIDQMEEATLERLFAQNAGVGKLYQHSHGYAVFDNRKFSLMITTGFGAGVAVNRSSGQRTYMKMATGGANVGLGGEFYQLVILFEDADTFRSFIGGSLEAGTGGGAVVGDEKVGADVRFTDGTAVYQLTEKGLKLAADITGTRYWKDEALN